MKDKLYRVFEECLTRIESGEPVQACLADYSRWQLQLVPLLHKALLVETMPKAVPSVEFKRNFNERLKARLERTSIPVDKSRGTFSGPGVFWRSLVLALAGPARVAVPLILVLMIVLEGLFLSGMLGFNLMSPASVLASSCTLTTINGDIELQRAGSTTWEKAKDGVTLEKGSWLRTAADSQALLTFFNGTTVRLGPDTRLLVEQLEGSAQKQSSVIVLRQWLGKTWSRVEKLADPASRYEILTPSASALVRGTQFVTEVDDTGATTVRTIEGLVSVAAQGQEVYVAAGQQTAVAPGASPSAPVPMISSEVEIYKVNQVEPSSLVATAEPEAASQLPEIKKSTDPEKEVLAPVSAGNEPPAKGQTGLPKLGQESGQRDDMWWIVLGALLFSLGVAAYMWRRQ